MTATERPGRFVITERYARAAAAQAVDAIDVVLDRRGRDTLLAEGDPELALTADQAWSVVSARDTLSRVAFGEAPLRHRVADVQGALRALDAGHGSEAAVIEAARALAEPVEVHVAPEADGCHE